MLTAPALLLGCLAMGRAESPCARCHPSEVAAFERSPMGRSVGLPSVYTEGRIVHKLSGSTINHPSARLADGAYGWSGAA